MPKRKIQDGPLASTKSYPSSKKWPGPVTLPPLILASKRRKTDSSKSDGDKYFQGGDGSSPVISNLKKVFDTYRDNPADEPDKIEIAGADQYLKDLKIDLDEVAHFALCELLKCPSIGEFNRDEFVNGWRTVATGSNSCDSAARQADYINTTVRQRLANDTAYAKQVYRYAFKLAKPEGVRSVPMDSALEFWNLFFRKGRGGIEWNSATTKWLDLWVEFYENNVKRPVNKDLWNMVGEVVLKTKQADGEDFAWWSVDGAWPMAIDDFVAYVKEKRNDGMDTT